MTRVKVLEGVVKELVDATDRRSEAVDLYFTKVMHMPAPPVPELQAMAHTLSYDLSITVRGPARLAQAAGVRSTTLVMDGGASPPWMRNAIEALARAIPGARHRSLEGQTHAVDPQALASALEEFFSA